MDKLTTSYDNTIYPPISSSRHQNVDRLPPNRYTLGMKTQSGFSLIELSVTMVIMLVVAVIAVPSVTQMINENQLQAQLNGLIVDMNFARSEAIKRNQSVVLCPRATATTCATVNWENGWLIYADVINPGVLDVPGDTILKQRIALPTGVTIRATNGSAYENDVTYTRTGLVNASNDFVICDSRGFRGDDTRIINVRPTGRANATDNLALGSPYSDCLGNP